MHKFHKLPMMAPSIMNFQKINKKNENDLYGDLNRLAGVLKQIQWVQ